MKRDKETKAGCSVLCIVFLICFPFSIVCAYPEELIIHESLTATERFSTTIGTDWTLDNQAKGVDGQYAMRSYSYLATAEWRPIVGDIEPGAFYNISFYNARRTAAHDVSALYKVYVDGTLQETKTFDQSTASGTGSGWVLLGRYQLSGNGNDYITVTRGGNNLIVDALKFEKINFASSFTASLEQDVNVGLYSINIQFNQDADIDTLTPSNISVTTQDGSVAEIEKIELGDSLSECRVVFSPPLEYQKTYTVTLSGVTDLAGTGCDSELNFSTQESGLAFGDIGIYRGSFSQDNELEEYETGTMIVRRPVNSDGNSDGLVMVTALFKNHELIDAVFDYAQSLAKGERIFQNQIDIQYDKEAHPSEYLLKTMFWNSLTGMKPICTDVQHTPRITKPTYSGESWNSELLTKDDQGNWQYNTILDMEGRNWNIGEFDFSYAGYKGGQTNGMTSIPDNSVTIECVDGEDITQKLNDAIGQLKGLGGGTINIPAGYYVVGTDGAMVTIDCDNIFIKGAGRGVTNINVDGSFDQDRYSLGAFTWKGSGYWKYAPQITTVAPDSKIGLGSFTIPVVDADSINVGDYIVIRQIMWQEFVAKHSATTSDTRPYGWTNYDENDNPLYSDQAFAFGYYRKVTAKDGNILTVDVPMPYPLDPANKTISICRPSGQIMNCGMEGITFTTDAQHGKVNAYDSAGAVLMIAGLVDGWFKDIHIKSFNSFAFATEYPVNVTFDNCIAENARNRGGGGSGYAFYIRGQNLLYKNCEAIKVRHGWTTATSYTSNVVVKDCVSEGYTFEPNVTSAGEAVDDTHLQYAHAILWDNHYADHAGLMMMNRGTLSSNAYQTCGWTVVWNYYNTGNNSPNSAGNYLHRNELCVTPGDYGFVIGANGGEGLLVKDGYTRYPSTSQGVTVKTPDLQVGTAPTSGRNVMFEGTLKPGLEPASLYDAMLHKRLPKGQ